MKIELYNKIKLELKDYYVETPKEEIKDKLKTEFDYAYSIPDKDCYIGFRETTETLNKDAVETRLIDCCKIYSRIVPGFQRGELRIRKEEEFHMGIMTFKSYKVFDDIFNVIAVMNVDDKELFISMNCNMNTALAKSLEFMDILRSVQYIQE